jgi:hypothetical protein
MSATTDKDTGAAARPRLLLGQSIAKNLIVGEIVEENLFPYPAIRSRDREMLGQIVEAIDNYLEDKAADFRRWDREGAQPAEFIQSLRELGLFSLIIPEEYGGLALSNAAYARVLAQTSSYDSSVSLTIGAHSSIGMKGILLFGTPAQKERYLPRLATGELIAAFCLTESGAGSGCRVDTHLGETQRRRQLDPERREDLDHERRDRGFLYGVCPHGRTGRQDHGLRRRDRMAGRYARPPRGQDGDTRVLDGVRVLC